MRRTMVQAGVAVAAVLTGLGLQGAMDVSANAVPPPGGSSGHDVSWPQCGSAYPADGSFGVVGVTNGRAWSTNPCLGSEYTWAAAYPRTPDLYMNTANPAPQSSHYWPSSGAREPALCKDASLTTDPGCAYDYGWHTAADALATATATMGAGSAAQWWLDVETGNTWNGDASSNAADLQGSIDYLISQHVVGVGVYSTGYQWGVITGGYATSNASQYASAWSSEFTSPNGIANVPAWVAGASGPSDAASYCGSSFMGTSTWLVQYIAGGFDTDYACGAPPPPPPVVADYSITVPASTAATRGAAVNTTVTLTSTGGWSGTVVLSVRAPSQVTSSLSSTSIAVPANGRASARLTLRSSRSGIYTITVSGRPSSSSSTPAIRSASTSFTVKSGRSTAH